MIGVLAGGVAVWVACLLLDSMDGCLAGARHANLLFPDRRGGQSPGLPAL